jgi:hypothetical protein
VERRGWDEGLGTVSRAFDEWRLIDQDRRVFLQLSIEFADREYERIWNDIGSSPADPDGPEQPDLFHAAVHGLWPDDYEWMVRAAVLKDAVTSFEVYLEKAARELLAKHGWISEGGGGPNPSVGRPPQFLCGRPWRRYRRRRGASYTAIAAPSHAPARRATDRCAAPGLWGRGETFQLSGRANKRDRHSCMRFPSGHDTDG